MVRRLRGYLTKYDCSSADINPIGGISKVSSLANGACNSHLPGRSTTLHVVCCLGNEIRLAIWVRIWLLLSHTSHGSRIIEAPPTAELEPTTASYTQTDEQDMGMSYEELGVYGRLRKISQVTHGRSVTNDLTRPVRAILDVREAARPVGRQVRSQGGT